LIVATLLSSFVLLVAWLVVGLSTLRGYPALLSALTKVEGSFGFSTYALTIRLGLAPAAARMAIIVVLCALFGAALRLAQSRGGDAQVFAIAVVACLVTSPIVWLHYFALLIIPIAILSPTLSWAWFLPVATWFFANPNRPAATWKIIAGQLVILAVLWLAAKRAGETSKEPAQVGAGSDDRPVQAVIV
jgi:hypothetical protein